MSVTVAFPIGTTWRVSRWDHPTATVGPLPTADGFITFRDGMATDGRGSSASPRVDGEQIHFGRWINDLVGHYGGAPKSAPPTIGELRFLFAVLAGDTTWRAGEGELVIEKPSVGAVVFAAAGTDERSA